MRSSSTQPPRFLTRAAAVVALVVLAACGANAGAREPIEPSRPDLAPGAVNEVSTTIVDEPTTTTVAAVTETTLPKSELSSTLGMGNTGPEVKALQQRLTDLHFDVKKVDGVFGPNTEMAVWAYQALIMNLRGKDVTGKVTPALWSRMQEPLGLADKRPTVGTLGHVEIYLQAQAMVVYNKHQLKLITHVSTGDGEEWCAVPRILPQPGATTTSTVAGFKPQRICGKSTTPGGSFRVAYKRQGEMEVTLGRVYNPIFFNGGIAIHGYTEVPKNPASHGCVRVPMHIAEYLQDLIHVGDHVFVWDGVAEPEKYGAQRPPIDVPDPTDTTTTVASTTTTTVKATTTTVKPTTTTTAAGASSTSVKPAATTTTALPPVTVAPTTAPTTTTVKP
jgi:peptidoglycan hydrolase-like protein with peptidoglycan-binding domain